MLKIQCKDATTVKSIATVQKPLLTKYKHCNYTKTSPYKIQLLPPVWPFARWGIDIVGQLPTTPGNCKYAIVAVEYFSKWIEARVVQRITSQVI
jgi:hypothetical protein